MLLYFVQQFRPPRGVIAHQLLIHLSFKIGYKERKKKKKKVRKPTPPFIPSVSILERNLHINTGNQSLNALASLDLNKSLLGLLKLDRAGNQLLNINLAG